MDYQERGYIPLNNNYGPTKRILLLTLIVLIFIASTLYLDINYIKMIERSKNTMEVLNRMLGLNLAIIPDLLKATFTTVFLAFISVSLSLIFAFFLSFLAAENTAPISWLSNMIKGIIAIIRSIPTLILALIIVASIGFGNTSAIFVMTLSGTCTLARLFMGSIEEVKANQIEAISFTGSSRLGVIIHGILPTVITSFLSWITIHVENTISLSISLGVLGIKGIGLLLTNAQMQYKYTSISTIIIYIFILMFILEIATTKMREKINNE